MTDLHIPSYFLKRGIQPTGNGQTVIRLAKIIGAFRKNGVNFARQIGADLSLSAPVRSQSFVQSFGYYLRGSTGRSIVDARLGPRGVRKRRGLRPEKRDRSGRVISLSPHVEPLSCSEPERRRDRRPFARVTGNRRPRRPYFQDEVPPESGDSYTGGVARFVMGRYYASPWKDSTTVPCDEAAEAEVRARPNPRSMRTVACAPQESGAPRTTR